MTQPATCILRAARNVPFAEVLPFRCNGLPLDFTGYTGALQVRSVPGAPGAALIGLTTVTSDVEGIRFLAGGQIQIIIAETSFEGATIDALFAGLPPGAPVKLAFDLVLTDPTGFQQRYVKGDFILEPGVTD